jgi:glycosyltransferase involved in cell wall biosynthesis
VRWPWAADRFVTVLGGVSALPVPQPKVLTRSELGLGEDDRVVLLAGVPAPETGHAIGIEAFARLWRRLPEARLVIAGAEGRRSVLERRVRELEIEAVVRFAEAERPIADLLEAADVLLCPALRAGLPVPLLQAMRTGCPAVASRVGGIPEAVVDGETGWLVPPADPRAAAEALLHVLHDPARTRAFAAAARDRAAQDFDAPRMVAEAERHYRAGLAASRASAAARAREAAAQGG